MIQYEYHWERHGNVSTDDAVVSVAVGTLAKSLSVCYKRYILSDPRLHHPYTVFRIGIAIGFLWYLPKSEMETSDPKAKPKPEAEQNHSPREPLAWR